MCAPEVVRERALSTQMEFERAGLGQTFVRQCGRVAVRLDVVVAKRLDEPSNLLGLAGQTKVGVGQELAGNIIESGARTDGPPNNTVVVVAKR